jgi:hypothetical protein
LGVKRDVIEIGARITRTLVNRAYATTHQLFWPTPLSSTGIESKSESLEMAKEEMISNESI